MKKCPICNSTKLKVLGKSTNMRCDKCGYIHRESSRGTVVKGAMYDNWWMSYKS